MIEIGRLLIIIGLIITLTGVIILIATRLFPFLGSLPGDLRIETKNVKIYFPLATMLLVSIIGTILLNILIRIFRR